MDTLVLVGLTLGGLVAGVVVLMAIAVAALLVGGTNIVWGIDT